MAFVVGCSAFALYYSSIGAKSFEDEYAYITQSYYSDCFFNGAIDHPAWLDFFAYDLQPLPKYLIGLCLRGKSLPMPGPQAARNWYLSYAQFGTLKTLHVARFPSVILGSLGCVAMFGCGTLVKDSRTGLVAAVLFMLNPLYSLHAHRAMADVPCEAFVMIALGLALWAWKLAWSARGAAVSFLIWDLAGIAAGMGFSCKFNALLALMIVAVWTVIGVLAPRLRARRRLLLASGSIMMLVTAVGTSLALNPFLTAHPPSAFTPEARQLLDQNPWQRFLFQVRHRIRLSENQQRSFPDDALHTLAERCNVVAVQGFGRFGLFGPSTSDSRVRFDLSQDRGAIFWAAMVLFGLIESVALSQGQWRAGIPPTGIALLGWAAVAFLVVTIYLPMAWDRYLLPIQGVNALLAALGLSMVGDRLVQTRSTLRARA